ncbi:hypothetical protein [Pseudonocardia sp. GCM10023141]|uniref:hypothetical protein n=1 Tax=Pseudonocardia sp. GCM10023141 TaxID=3252653 RepID=UPI00361FACEE
MIEFLGALPLELALAVAALAVVAEAALLIGVVLPGASAALVTGALATAGVLPLPAAMAAVAAGALLGGQLAYLVGRHGRGTAAAVARLQAAGGRRGRAARAVLGRPPGCREVAAAQWLVGARTLVPRLAGAGGLGYRRFTTVQVPGALVWGAGLVAVGAAAGAAYRQAGALVTGIGVGVLIVGATVLIVRRRRGRERRPVPADALA